MQALRQRISNIFIFFFDSLYLNKTNSQMSLLVFLGETSRDSLSFFAVARFWWTCGHLNEVTSFVVQCTYIAAVVTLNQLVQLKRIFCKSFMCSIYWWVFKFHISFLHCEVYWGFVNMWGGGGVCIVRRRDSVKVIESAADSHVEESAR